MGSSTFVINAQIFAASDKAAETMQSTVDSYIKAYAISMKYDIELKLSVKSKCAVVQDDSGIKYNETTRQVTGGPLQLESAVLIFTKQPYYRALYDVNQAIQNRLPTGYLVLNADQAVTADEAHLAENGQYDVQLLGTQYQYRNPECALPVQHFIAERIGKIAQKIRVSNQVLNQTWYKCNGFYTRYGVLIAHSTVQNEEVNGVIHEFMSMPLGGSILRITH